MRRIILWMSISLDGYIEGVDGDITWHMVDDELHSHFNEELARMGAFIYGRVNYELMVDFWPTADQDPSASGPMADFASIWRDMPKIVYSTTLDTSEWNTTVYRDVKADEVRALKAEPGGDMVIGGSDLVAVFSESDLIDEYRVYVHPVLIGRGKPLFAATDKRTDLRLLETRSFGNGVALLRYERAGPA